MTPTAKPETSDNRPIAATFDSVAATTTNPLTRARVLDERARVLRHLRAQEPNTEITQVYDGLDRLLLLRLLDEDREELRREIDGLREEFSRSAMVRSVQALRVAVDSIRDAQVRLEQGGTAIVPVPTDDAQSRHFKRIAAAGNNPAAIARAHTENMAAIIDEWRDWSLAYFEKIDKRQTEIEEQIKTLLGRRGAAEAN